jgi:hypothetical protein
MRIGAIAGGFATTATTTITATTALTVTIATVNIAAVTFGAASAVAGRSTTASFGCSCSG